MENLIETFFSFICHQDKDILIRIYDEFIPLCPRCIGLHVGFFVSSITFLFRRNQNLFLNPKTKFALIILTSLAGIHWLLGDQGIVTPSSLSRFYTGFLSGIGFGLLLNSIIKLFDSYRFNKRRIISIKFVLTILLILSGITLKEILFLELALLIIVLNNLYNIGYSLSLLTTNHIKLIKQEVLK